MSNQQKFTDLFKRLKTQNRNLETIDPDEIKAAEEWARRKGPSWVKLPNVNVEVATDGFSGRYKRDEFALWLRLNNSTEIGRKSIATAGNISIGWYLILYSTISDPRSTGNARVRWQHFIRDMVTGKQYLGLFSSPPNDVHDTIANAVYMSSEIKQQIKKIIQQKIESKSKQVYDLNLDLFI